MRLSDLAHVVRSPRVPRWKKLLVLAAAAYVVLPVDLIPDVIPVFGWLDDLGVVGLAVAWLTHEARHLRPA